ncbi:MAG: 50S ribosomal protein L25 [Planctomycetes bacterium]|nr:50S ribosomal protein L25 [Planctomycetota bacterium]MBL7007639.1 50S ribosomal protein L25 [Planctomycetota bacterium]
MTILQAEARTSHGTRNAFNLRRDGRLPAVVYGEGGETFAVTVDAHAFEGLLRHHERVLDLELDGQTQQVMIHEIQWDHMGDQLMHIDFIRASQGTLVEVDVVLDFVGHPKGTPKGEFVKNLQELSIQATPRSIPEHIVVHVTDLDVGDVVHVSDLEMPEGVTCLAEPETVVCGVHARAEEVEETEEGEAAEGGGAEPEVIGKGKGPDDEAE